MRLLPQHLQLAVRQGKRQPAPPGAFCFGSRRAYKAADQAALPGASSVMQIFPARGGAACRAQVRDSVRRPLEQQRDEKGRVSPGLLFWAHGLAVGNTQVLQGAGEAVATPDSCEVALLLGQILQATEMPCKHNAQSCIWVCTHTTELSYQQRLLPLLNSARSNMPITVETLSASFGILGVIWDSRWDVGLVDASGIRSPCSPLPWLMAAVLRAG